MKVITIAAPKGGTGKTTVTTALAARAAKESKRVVMIDLNADQANLTQWWTVRGEPDNPLLVEVQDDDLIGTIAELRKDKFEYCILDTPPLDMTLIEGAVSVSDAVIIPVRTSIFDVGSIDPIVEMCKARKKPFAFVLSAVDVKFKALTATAEKALASEGKVLETRISYRLPYINALTIGKSGFEVDKDLKAEIDAFWSEVKTLASVKATVKGRA